MIELSYFHRFENNQDNCHSVAALNYLRASTIIEQNVGAVQPSVPTESSRHENQQTYRFKYKNVNVTNRSLLFPTIINYKILSKLTLSKMNSFFGKTTLPGNSFNVKVWFYMKKSDRKLIVSDPISVPNYREQVIIFKFSLISAKFFLEMMKITNSPTF